MIMNLHLFLTSLTGFFINLNLIQKYYEPEFSEILIAATNSDSKININRVSGLIKITSKNSKNDGKCDILDNTKF